MRRTTVLVIWCSLLALGVASGASAQGVQTGILRGTVIDQQDLPVPGVVVTATSEVLQGGRTTRTEGDGTYVFLTLPPGAYTVLFDISGFAPAQRMTFVPLGGSVNVDIALSAAGVAEDVQVVGTATVVATAPVGLNIRQDEVDALAIGRTLYSITTLSPGLNENTPNASQVSISGAFAYDNLFMLNGVDVNDNLFGSPQDLFIEDAIAETQVMTTGLSAEYGRFTGGVINAITKSGGNTFAGSYRLNLSNPSWTDETPFEEDNDVDLESDLNLTNEMTFGGPLMQDMLWFFAAGRFANIATSGAFPVTGIPFATEDKNRRVEIKLTGTPVMNHSFQFGYLNNYSESINAPSFDFSIDPTTVVNDQRPNWYTFANYRGVARGNLLVEAQYTERRFAFENSGGTDTAIENSPMFHQFQFHYNAPYFDGNDFEQRNNRQFTASTTGFFEGMGRHEAKGGFEYFRSQITGGGGQSATDFVFYADFLTDDDGAPVLDGEGRLIPTFVPFYNEFDHWIPSRGARLNIDTTSFYLQDRWTLDERTTASVGIRYERVRSDADGLVGVDTDTVMPRLALAYDVEGDGSFVLNTTYGHYSGRYNEATISANGNVAQPSLLLGVYTGPAGQGRDFAPGFDSANYFVYSGRFPTANVSFEEGMSSPVVKEFTVSAGKTIGSRAYAEAAYVWRNTSNLIEDFVDLSNGATLVELDGNEFGPFTNSVYRNSDFATRAYQGLVLQGRYQVRPNWSMNGHWTVQLKNEGNYEGEASGQPGLVSIIGDYPEAMDEARHFPMGRLSSFQRHRIRFWSIYDVALGDTWGDLQFSGLIRVESARVYSLRALESPLSPTQEAIIFDLGYPDIPSNPDLYFGERGSEDFAGFGALDLSVNYNIPLWRQLRPWIKIDIFNALNNDKLITWNTNVSPDFEGPVDELGLPTTFVEDPSFGEAQSSFDFPAPRTFRVSVGFRF